MIGPLRPTHARLPYLGSKHQHRQQKEDTRDFEPHDTADAAKGLQESAHAAAGLRGHAAGSLAGAAHATRAGPCGTRAGDRRRARSSSRLRTCNILPRHASRYAQSHSQRTPDGLRSHSVYDVNSDPLSRACAPSPIVLFRHRKKISNFPTRWISRGPLLEVIVTSRLRELIQQLGEAIHESVIESEQIAGVVQDIRKHGFDVLLMLEATIGLNEVNAADTKEGEEGEEAREAGAFTQNDLHFLRSLRISVEGDRGEDSDSAQD